MKRKLQLKICVLAGIIVLLLAGCSLQQNETSAVPDTTPEHNQVETPDSEETPSTESDAVKEEDPADTWQFDPATITDEYILQEVVGLPEIALVNDGFTFGSPEELSSEKLFMLFQLWTDYDKLEACRNPEDQLFYFSEEMIRATLDRYFKEYTFDITTCKNYDADSGCVVVPIASGFGGDRDVRMVEKQFDQTIGTFTIDFHQKLYNDERPDTEVYQRKVYTVEFYDGGLYYLSAEVVPVNG